MNYSSELQMNILELWAALPQQHHLSNLVFAKSIPEQLAVSVCPCNVSDSACYRRCKILVQRHPAGGCLEFIIMEATVALRCHWPIDLTDDEWIDIENNYSITGYLQAVDDAISTGNGLAQGITSGYLRIISVPDGFVIEFSRPQEGWSASSLSLHLRRPIVELLPVGAASASRSPSVWVALGPAVPRTSDIPHLDG